MADLWDPYKRREINIELSDLQKLKSSLESQLQAIQENIQDVISNRTANHILRSQMFGALLFADKDENDKYSLVCDQPVSTLLFPTPTRAIKTGSRAERVYLDDSDVDFIYEIDQYKVKLDPDSKSLYKLHCKQSDTPGFYYIYDDNKGYLPPKVIQVKVGPAIKTGKETLSQKYYKNYEEIPEYNRSDFKQIADANTKAALPNGIDDEDNVICIPLSEWPKDVKEHFEKKCLWCKDLNIKEITLYLVPKSPSGSRESNDNSVWRLSFSMVEKEIMLQVADVHRKAYLICKLLRKKIFKQDEVKSFAFKTVFLMKLDDYHKPGEYGDELSGDGEFNNEGKLFILVQNIFDKLLDCIENKKLPNYFLPDLDLYKEIFDPEGAKGKLKRFLGNIFNKIEEYFSPFDYRNFYSSHYTLTDVIDVCNDESQDDKIVHAVLVCESYNILLDYLYHTLVDTLVEIKSIRATHFVSEQSKEEFLREHERSLSFILYVLNNFLKDAPDFESSSSLSEVEIKSLQNSMAFQISDLIYADEDLIIRFLKGNLSEDNKLGSLNLGEHGDSFFKSICSYLKKEIPEKFSYLLKTNKREIKQPCSFFYEKWESPPSTIKKTFGEMDFPAKDFIQNNPYASELYKNKEINQFCINDPTVVEDTFIKILTCTPAEFLLIYLKSFYKTKKVADNLLRCAGALEKLVQLENIKEEDLRIKVQLLRADLLAHFDEFKNVIY